MRKNEESIDMSTPKDPTESVECARCDVSNHPGEISTKGVDEYATN
jgi:hypothetical protein